MKAFDFASDTCKQLIALATGVTTVTVAFEKDVIGGVPDSVTAVFNYSVRQTLGISWAAYLLSVICGMVTIMALTGQLATSASPSIYLRRVTIPGITQCLTFLAGTVLIALAGTAALAHH